MKLDKLAIVGALAISSASPVLAGCGNKPVEQPRKAEVAHPPITCKSTCEELKQEFHDKLRALDGLEDKQVGESLTIYLDMQNTLQFIRGKCEKELAVPAYERLLQKGEAMMDAAIAEKLPSYQPISSASDNANPVCSEERK
jgi:hypothetical protein